MFLWQTLSILSNLVKLNISFSDSRCLPFVPGILAVLQCLCWFLRMQCGVQLGHLWPVLVNGCVTGAPSRKSPMNKQRAPSAEQRSAQLCRSLLSQAKPPSWPCNTAIVKWLELCVLTYCPWQDSIYIMLPMAHWWCVASVWGVRGGCIRSVTISFHVLSAILDTGWIW